MSGTDTHAAKLCVSQRPHGPSNHYYTWPIDWTTVPKGARTSRDASPDLGFSFIDLFAGIGGFRIGLERAGGRCVFSSEWDRFARETYEANFNERPLGDIRRIRSDQIPPHDILAAGFPCQPFSIAGVSKKASLARPTGFDDEIQGTLFFEVARILRASRPKAFLLENVKNLLHHDKGRTLSVILSTLNKLGYDPTYRLIDAVSVVPQHRERVFIVGFRRDLDLEPFVIPPVRGVYPTLSGILCDEVDSRYTLSDHLWAYLRRYAAKHKAAGNGFGFGLVQTDGISRTLSARYFKDGAEILIPQPSRNPRRLTPRECARLMGFPETFRIPVSDTQAYKQFGNAVVPAIVETIGRRMALSLSREGRSRAMTPLP
jgi:DNA (cytosine-5)-methyltransferase 1